MNNHRIRRLEKRILQLLADLYFRELKNPNIGFVTFTRCQLSRDYSHAKIFVSIYEGEDGKRLTLRALRQYTSFIRGRIAKTVRMKKIPQISFLIDDSLNKAEKIEALLKETNL